MTYQDIWVNGKCTQRGYRECEDRYEIIKTFCKIVFSDSFSVCDIGANMCYFGIRLSEDFNCYVRGYESHLTAYKKATNIIAQNYTNKVELINEKINAPILQIEEKFDLILALSVIHHCKDNLDLYIKQLMKISRYVIMEIADSDSKRVKGKVNFPVDPIFLGYGASHLKKGYNRQIILLK